MRYLVSNLSPNLSPNHTKYKYVLDPELYQLGCIWKQHSKKTPKSLLVGWVHCAWNFPFHMVLYLNWLNKGFRTPLATVWPFTCMSSCMHFQVSRCLERFLTISAGKGSNFTVINHMCFQTGFSNKNLSAITTWIQSFCFMRDHVLFQTGIFRTHFSTFPTRIFFWRMGVNVYL